VAGLLRAGGGAGLASGAGTGAAGEPRGAPAGTDRLREELHRQTRRADALQDRLDSAGTAAAATAGRRARALDAAEEGLALPGVLLRRGGESVTVLFETGLFPHDTVITREGAALLGRIGRRLADMDVTTTVTGHTATVPGSPSSGGSALALARARVAVDHLSRDGGPPLTAFTLTSGDQRGAPFPDAPRNRTVTLLVTPGERPAAR
jgi:flagellar motor protein MotB